MASLFNIAKSSQSDNTKDDPYAEKTLLAMWKASADLNVKCTSASFSPQADFLAIGTDEGSTSIFNPRTGRVVMRLGHTPTKQSAALSSALLDNGRGSVMAVKFNPTSGSPKVRVALSTGVVECYNAKNGSSSGANKIEGGQTLALDYSEQGKYYAAGGMDPKTAEFQGHAVRVYDDGTSKLTNTLVGDATQPGHSNRICCIRFKGNSELATGSLDGTVKLWSVGCKDPIKTFPMPKPSGGGLDEQLFEVSGASIDFQGDYMLVGSNRPHKHLQIYDVRMDRLVGEVPWRKLKPATTAAANRWNRAKIAHVRKSNILSACFTEKRGGYLVAGGTGANTVKVFTPNLEPPTMAEAYPVGEPVDEEEPVRELYSAVASIELPSAITGIDVSPKPVIRKGDDLGEGEKAKEDMRLMAVATGDGFVYGIKLPRDMPRRAEP